MPNGTTPIAPLAQPIAYMEWLTTAYPQTEKSKGWYIVMGLIVALFVAYDLLTGGWVISITFLILAAVYYYSESKGVPTVKVSISDHGVRFGSRYFLYSEIKSFWMVDEDYGRFLYLNLYKGAQRSIAIMVPNDINLPRLREYLRRELTEEEGKKEPFSDRLIRNFGL